MAWMNVTVYIPNKNPEPNVVNIDNIVRYGPNPNSTGSYICTVDGNSFEVIDPVDEITATILKAQAGG